MDDVPRQTLCELIDEYGDSLCEDGRRCEALLRDYCPEHRREIFALISALHEGVASGLRQSRTGMPIEATIKQLRTRLSERLGLTDDLSLWAVETWALALELVDPEDVDVIHFLCPKCGMSGDIPSRLAGKDVTCRGCRAIVHISRDGKRFVLRARRMNAGRAADAQAVPGWSVSAEDLLRQALRVALADGKIVAMENVMLEGLRRRLGLPAEAANRMLNEVTAEGGAGRTDADAPLFVDWPKASLSRRKVRLPPTHAPNPVAVGAAVGSALGASAGGLIGNFFGPGDSVEVGAFIAGVLALAFVAIFLSVIHIAASDWRGGCAMVAAVMLGCWTGWAVVALGGGVLIGGIGGAVLGAVLGAGGGALASITGKQVPP